MNEYEVEKSAYSAQNEKQAVRYNLYAHMVPHTVQWCIENNRHIREIIQTGQDRYMVFYEMPKLASESERPAEGE